MLERVKFSPCFVPIDVQDATIHINTNLQLD